MHIRIGYDISFQFVQATPMVAMLHVHPTRAGDVLQPDLMATDPPVPLSSYYDSFGNHCTRLVAPAGPFRLMSQGLVRDSGQLDVRQPGARQLPVQELPAETLLYLLGSRYCETDRLLEFAWANFGHVEGFDRVQAICSFVHSHLTFGYQHARATRSAWEGFNERVGVCRDFAHLALTLCRCTNIPARYVTGYLGDIGVPPDSSPMDFSGWFEAYLDGKWHTFDARHNKQRIGRIPIAYGRDAADVAITTTFGPNTLTGFKVWTDEVVASAVISG